MTKPRLAILGAGKLGMTLAQLGLQAGYDIRIAGSGAPESIRLSVQVLAPGAVAMTSAAAIEAADVVILALPLSNYQTIPKQLLSGKLVIDAMNYWWEVDGDSSDLVSSAASTSELIQTYLDESRLVKAFSHIGYHHLHDDARPPETKERKAIAIAGNDTEANNVVAEIVDDFGFDPLIIGDLARGRMLEPGQPAFGAHVNIDDLKKLV